MGFVPLACIAARNKANSCSVYCAWTRIFGCSTRSYVKTAKVPQLVLQRTQNTSLGDNIRVSITTNVSFYLRSTRIRIKLVCNLLGFFLCDSRFYTNHNINHYFSFWCD